MNVVAALIAQFLGKEWGEGRRVTGFQVLCAHLQAVEEEDGAIKDFIIQGTYWMYPWMDEVGKEGQKEG